MGLLVSHPKSLILYILIINRIVAIVVGFCFILIFLFVPETFWDRTPKARTTEHHHHHHFARRGHHHDSGPTSDSKTEGNSMPSSSLQSTAGPPSAPRAARVGFALDSEKASSQEQFVNLPGTEARIENDATSRHGKGSELDSKSDLNQDASVDVEKQTMTSPDSQTLASGASADHVDSDQLSVQYTDYYREAPAKSYVHTLKPWNGRLVKDKWLKVACRPFILFAYPAVLWSSMVYALAVGWLIVLSESVAHIYQDSHSYNFTSLQVGLVYISPFVGGVLGTAVAGKVSDLVVRFMARRNDGVYEPEFRLVMAIPIALTTVIGLMGFGWSAEEKDAWIVPTVFFGIISFGCSLASTTAVTFCVDSYRVYAGEALVTLNVCKSKSIRYPATFASC